MSKLLDNMEPSSFLSEIERLRTKNERLRAALEEIVRESNGVNKGALSQKLAIDALAEDRRDVLDKLTAETEKLKLYP